MAPIVDGSEESQESEEEEFADGDDGDGDADDEEAVFGGGEGDAADVDAEQASEEAEWEEDGGDEGEEVGGAVDFFGLSGEGFFVEDGASIAEAVEVLDEAGDAVVGFAEVVAVGVGEAGEVGVGELLEGVALGLEVSVEVDGVASDLVDLVREVAAFGGVDGGGLEVVDDVVEVVEDGLDAFGETGGDGDEGGGDVLGSV